MDLEDTTSLPGGTGPSSKDVTENRCTISQNDKEESSANTVEQYQPFSQVNSNLLFSDNVHPNRPLKSSKASCSSSRLSIESLDSLKLRQEILEEEMAIKIEELELRKRRLSSKKETLKYLESQRRDDFDDEAEEQYHSVFDNRIRNEGTGRYFPRREAAKTEHLAVAPLPKIEIDRFDGSPTKFWRFMKSFKMSVADLAQDDNQRLMYLMHYCTGAAKEAIEHCVLLPDREGYNKAMEILQTQFGRPHDIAESFINEILHGSSGIGDDVEALRRLVRQMINCEIVLTQMNHTADLNCSTTIKKVVRRLPRHLQLKWAEVADDVLHNGIEPSFRHLIIFLEKRLSVSSNCYGQMASTSRKPVPCRYTDRPSINLISSREARCQACFAMHWLGDCQNFKDMVYVDRLALVKRSKTCFNCLKVNHRVPECRAPPRCTVPGCNRSHHTLLHATAAEINATLTDGQGTYLSFVPVRLTGPLGSVDVYAFLDGGSDSTLLTTEVAKHIGLTGQRMQLEVTSIGGTCTKTMTAVSLRIDSLDGDYQIDVEKAYTVDDLPISNARVPTEATLERWPHLRDVTLYRLANPKVAMLIGANVSEAHWVLKQLIGTPNQPYAYRTVLGWTVTGPVGNKEAQTTSVNLLNVENSIDSDILRLFESELKGSQEGDEKGMSVDDRKVMDLTHRSVAHVDGHYQLRMPWKIDWNQLPDNRMNAEKRLYYLRSRFLKNEELRMNYTEIIAAYEAKGYVSRVPNDLNVSRRFLPHHPVINARKPNKLRIVFDFAAKTFGTSLNDCLHTGPDLTNDLTGVLLRFRLHRIAMAADIEEMFLQVRLPSEDKPPLSFLWFPAGQLDSRPEVYQLNVHPFGATSSPFCATFALRQTALDHESEFDSKTIQVVRDNFYVDDCLVSVETTSEAVRIVDELRRLLDLGGFRLHKWVSNCKEALEATPVSERASDIVPIDSSNYNLQKTLGLYWCVASDSFRFKVNLPARPVTKRGILSCAASLYDPLGYVAPLSLQPKRILQELCRNQCGWDEPVNQHITAAWETWQEDIRRVEALYLPRCVKPEGSITNRTSLHMFSDASELGYGAVGYLRSELSNGDVTLCFLMGKSRVAPLKPVTIPRLELQAAVLSVRLMRHIVKEMKMRFDTICLWTDSNIVLQYIANTSSRFKTFVANRVAFIRENTDSSRWKFVPSGDNPADVVSRGVTSRNFIMLQRWIQGPPFLLLSEKQWPTFEECVNHAEIPQSELKRKATICITAVSGQPMDHLISYYSSWVKLKRAVAWFTRFKTFLQSVRRDECRHKLKHGRLHFEEFKEAELAVLRYVQRTSFPAFFKASNQDIVALKNSPLYKLHPYLWDGLLCVGGRLQNSNLDQSSKHPIILPSRHPVVDTIIWHSHVTEGHMGTVHTLAKLREKYWIIKGAAAVKRIIHRCIDCRSRSAMPVSQIMSNLPESRVIPDFPFASTGIDYFGPFYVRVGRNNIKRYGCIFTCMKTRAVHIEVSHSLTTDSFLMAFARFVNRRGCPKEVYSDQGTNFVGAEHELRLVLKTLSREKLSHEVLARDIDWHFNPPYSSHRGGVWERMIRSVRRILSALSREQSLTEESLITYLTEVERILNDRPLVPVYEDPESLDVLTPNHILRLKEPSGASGDHVDLRERYTRHWRQAQLLADTFWRRWTKEYLPTLQGRGRWNTARRDLNLGDLVLILGENQPRGCWPKGIIVETAEGSDGHIRDVAVRTATGIVRRDIRKICLLEGIEER